MGAVILEKFFDVDISHAIPVGQHERISIEIFLHTFDTSAGHGIESCIDQGDFPRFQDIVVHDHLIFLGKIKSDVAVVKIIVCKPFFDHMLFVSTADNKFIKSISRIHFHNMPEDRLLPDLDHRLRLQMALLADTGTKTAC